MINPRGGDFYLATSGDNNLAVDTAGRDCGVGDGLTGPPLVTRCGGEG
jgi:hypothetical protein